MFYYITADKIMIGLTNLINIRGIEGEKLSLAYYIMKRRIDFLSIMTAYCKYKTRGNKTREMADAKETCGRGELRANSRREEEPFSSLALISFA